MRRLLPTMALVFLTSLPLPASAKDKPLTVVPGKSVAGLAPGMTLDAAKKAKGFHFEADGIERTIGKGWQSGAVLLIVDAEGKVKSISVELEKTAGVRVGKVVLAPTATLEQAWQALKGCNLNDTSGSRMVECHFDGGGAMHFFERAKDSPVRLVLP